MTAAESQILAVTEVSVLSLRRAVRLNSWSLHKKFSISGRHLQMSGLVSNGLPRLQSCEITILALRAFKSAMTGSVSKA